MPPLLDDDDAAVEPPVPLELVLDDVVDPLDEVDDVDEVVAPPVPPELLVPELVLDPPAPPVPEVELLVPPPPHAAIATMVAGTSARIPKSFIRVPPRSRGMGKNHRKKCGTLA